MNTSRWKPRSEPRTTDHGPRTTRRRGFTMIELLMVIIIIGILMALLLPAIQSAMRTARNAAVSSEINQLAQALENFKSRYGDYPPSRFLRWRAGITPVPWHRWQPPPSSTVDPTSPARHGDITVGQLAQRPVARHP